MICLRNIRRFIDSIWSIARQSSRPVGDNKSSLQLVTNYDWGSCVVFLQLTVLSSRKRRQSPDYLCLRIRIETSAWVA